MIEELNGIEYFVERHAIRDFKVGDLIGSTSMLVTVSESHPTDSSMWKLSWLDEDDITHQYEGFSNGTDMRWRVTFYIIEESDV